MAETQRTSGQFASAVAAAAFFNPGDKKSDLCVDLESRITRIERMLKVQSESDGFSMPFSTDSFEQDLRTYRDLYNQHCRADPVEQTSRSTEAAKDTKTSQFTAISLPGDTVSTGAAAGAEGVYGASPLTFWEAAIVSEAKAMGESAKELALPVMAFGVLALGVVKAVRTGDTSVMQRAWATVKFHARAAFLSIAESASDAASGFVNLVAEKAPEQTVDFYSKVERQYGSAVAAVLTPFAYLSLITVIPTGEAIGTGAAMIGYGKKWEEKTLGAAALFSGLCSAVGMGAGALMPKPTLSIPTISTMAGSDGALAFAGGAVTVGVPVGMPIGGMISAASVGGGRQGGRNPRLTIEELAEQIARLFGADAKQIAIQLKRLFPDEAHQFQLVESGETFVKIAVDGRTRYTLERSAYRQQVDGVMVDKVGIIKRGSGKPGGSHYKGTDPVRFLEDQGTR